MVKCNTCGQFWIFAFSPKCDCKARKLKERAKPTNTHNSPYKPNSERTSANTSDNSVNHQNNVLNQYAFASLHTHGAAKSADCSEVSKVDNTAACVQDSYSGSGYSSSDTGSSYNDSSSSYGDSSSY